MQLQDNFKTVWTYSAVNPVNPVNAVHSVIYDLKNAKNLWFLLAGDRTRPSYLFCWSYWSSSQLLLTVTTDLNVYRHGGKRGPQRFLQSKNAENLRFLGPNLLLELQKLSRTLGGQFLRNWVAERPDYARLMTFPDFLLEPYPLEREVLGQLRRGVCSYS